MLFSSSFLLRAATVLAVIAALAVLLAGPGLRYEFWSVGFAFRLLLYGTYLGFAAGGLALLGAVVAKRWRQSMLVLLIVAAAVAGPLYMKHQGQQVPPIHDITTDTQDPPRFVAILPLRRDAPNPSEHPGAGVAAQQKAAYPTLTPLELPLSLSDAFDDALAAVRQSGWELVAAQRDAGRIEATARTFWFGFRDDVVIRLTAQEHGTRLDMRSVSRVGRSDLGANARRIEAFLAKLRDKGKE